MTKTLKSNIAAIRFNDKEKTIGVKFKERKCCICGEIHREGFLYYQFDNEIYKQTKKEWGF